MQGHRKDESDMQRFIYQEVCDVLLVTIQQRVGLSAVPLSPLGDPVTFACASVPVDSSIPGLLDSQLFSSRTSKHFLY
jgi:hypothetical protein